MNMDVAKKYARLAQLVEQLVYTEKVGSSSLSSRTSIRKAGFIPVFLVLDLGERLERRFCAIGLSKISGVEELRIFCSEANKNT